MFSWKKQGLVPACLTGAALSAAAAAALCLGLTPLFTAELLPLERAGDCAAAAAGLSVFGVVLALARSRGRQALPAAGLVCGGFLLLSALVCALGGGGFAFGSWYLSLAAVTAGGALLGAIMSLRPKRRPRRRPRG